MNKQNPGIEWTHPYGRPGYTWNVIGGCFHKCRWTMPDDVQAVCYAETTAENVAQRAYPQGFMHHYFHPARLEEPLKLKEPAGIFLDSMSDLMGHWVPDWQINSVLDICGQASQHIFFLLTKNAPRLLRFRLPPNVWAGISMPPDYFMGRKLTQFQKERMFKHSLSVLAKLEIPVRWVSFEPLSYDVSQLIGDVPPFEWAVIGAASNGRNYYLPEESHVRNLLAVLDRWRVSVFYKGNLRGSPAAEPWREKYPDPTLTAAD